MTPLPIQKGAGNKGWVLGNAGVLFTYNGGGGEKGALTEAGLCATTPHARALAEEAGLGQLLLQEDAREGGGEREGEVREERHAGRAAKQAVGTGELGWKPKWNSGYPAVRDLKAAIRYIRATAQTYNVDPTKVAASGGSAGATNSLAAGTSSVLLGVGFSARAAQPR